jgi:hypothetical protein
MTVFSCQKTSHQQLEHQNAILARSALQTREGRAAKPLQNIEYVSEYTANVQSSLPMRARINPATPPHKPPTPPHAITGTRSQNAARVSLPLRFTCQRTKPNHSVSSLPG